MLRIATWLIGALGSSVVGALITIFVFDYYEPGFGRAGTLKLSLTFGLVFGVVGVLSYLFGSLVRRSFQSPSRALLSGVIFQGMLLLATEGIKYAVPTLNSFVTAVLLAVILGSASSLLFRNHVA